MSLSLTTPIVEPCPHQITGAHRRQFAELGYVAFEGVLAPGEVHSARAALAVVARRLIQAARCGQTQVLQAPPNAPRNYAGPRVVKPGCGCSIHFEAGVDPLALSDDEAELCFGKLAGYEHEHPAFAALVAHPRMRGFLSHLVGQEMVLKDVMALSKPPFLGSEKPWHQDNAYFNWLPLEWVATTWIALDDATVGNGCMHLLPGQHRRGPLRHHHTIDCKIVADRIDPAQAIPVEVPAGSVLYFSAMLPHQTPANTNPQRRRALQFQYRGAACRQVSHEEFGRAFAEADGTPASCALAYQTG
ncbi:MAG: phytanoyl-CoA dioxygenase family protein [Candidatus Latescibacterota bacterium]